MRVSVALDMAPLDAELPADFVAVLSSDAKAVAYLAGLTLSQKKGFTGPIEPARELGPVLQNIPSTSLA